MVYDCFGPIPSKIGLIPSPECMRSIGQCLEAYDVPFVVLDPVLSPSSNPLIRFNPPRDLAETLFPLVSLATPNIPEAEALLGRSIDSIDDMVEAASEIQSSYGCSILLKGGHLGSTVATDVYCANGDPFLLEAPPAPLASAHGSGCFLSASITAFYALGFDLATAIPMAKNHVSKAFSNPVDVQGFPLLSSGP